MSVIKRKTDKQKKKRLTGKERQTQILEQAQYLCAKKGFSGTTLDEIARKSGVSRALVVQHFGSKEGLYEALIDYLFKYHPMEDDPDIKKYMEKKDDYGVFKAYFKHAYKYMTKDKEHSPLRLILFSMLEKPDLYERHYKQRFAKGLSVLEQYISKRIDDKAFRDVNPKHVAIAFSAMLTQLLIQEITVPRFRNEKAFMNCIETMITLFINGLNNRD